MRELVVLGTAAQAPTRERNHNGYLLRWDGEGVLFDPGEGTQRQLLHAGVASTAITRICVTHGHGDHLFGLPGVLARMGLDEVTRTVDVYCPASAAPAVEVLVHLAGRRPPVRLHPIDSDGDVEAAAGFVLHARALEHRIDTYGYRVGEPAGRRMLPERLAAAGISGPDVGVLQRAGELRGVRLEDVSVPRPGQVFAFVMDTRVCAAAVELARGADLVVCEATYAAAEAALAEAHAHLTAAQAATIARDAGARRLVLTHFSQRYADTGPLLAEARAVFPDTVAVRDLDRVPLPPRRSGEPRG
jgi:ribonuclease Z